MHTGEPRRPPLPALARDATAGRGPSRHQRVRPCRSGHTKNGAQEFGWLGSQSACLPAAKSPTSGSCDVINGTQHVSLKLYGPQQSTDDSTPFGLTITPRAGMSSTGPRDHGLHFLTSDDRPKGPAR